MTQHDDDAVKEKQQPLIEHLIEFKRRLLIAVAAFLLATILAYAFAEDIYAFIVRPLAESFGDHHARRMIYTGLTEAFFTYLRLAVFAGIFLSFPVIATQVYAFIAPGLYKRERKVFLPYLVAAPALFLTGAALCYYGVMPVAWKFFLSFEQGGAEGALPIALEARVGEYLSLTMHLMLAFGLSFQLPVLLTLLAQAGMIHPETLAKGRRYAVVIIAACCAIITPPDAISMLGLMVPLYLLYEISIHLCRIIVKNKEKREIADA